MSYTVYPQSTESQSRKTQRLDREQEAEVALSECATVFQTPNTQVTVWVANPYFSSKQTGMHTG